MNALFSISELEHLNDQQLDALRGQLLSLLMATARTEPSRKMILGALDNIERLVAARSYRLVPSFPRTR